VLGPRPHRDDAGQVPARSRIAWTREACDLDPNTSHPTPAPSSTTASSSGLRAGCPGAGHGWRCLTSRRQGQGLTGMTLDGCLRTPGSAGPAKPSTSIPTPPARSRDRRVRRHRQTGCEMDALGLVPDGGAEPSVLGPTAHRDDVGRVELKWPLAQLRSQDLTGMTLGGCLHTPGSPGPAKPSTSIPTPPTRSRDRRVRRHRQPGCEMDALGLVPDGGAEPSVLAPTAHPGAGAKASQG